jgi:hypothetical protein
MGQSTSTSVLGLMAMPALMPCAWMNLMSFFGFVRSSDAAAGESAAVDAKAAS